MLGLIQSKIGLLQQLVLSGLVADEERNSNTDTATVFVGREQIGMIQCAQNLVHNGFSLSGYVIDILT